MTEVEKNRKIAELKDSIAKVKLEMKRRQGGIARASEAMMAYDPNTAMGWLLNDKKAENKVKSGSGITGNKLWDIQALKEDKATYKTIVDKAVALKKRLDSGLDVNSPEFSDAYGEIMSLNASMNKPSSKDELIKLIELGDKARRLDLDEKKFDSDEKKEKQKVINEAIKTSFDATESTLSKVKDSASQLSKVFGLMESGSPNDIKSAVKILISSLDNSAVMGNEGEMYANQSLPGQIESFLQKWLDGNAFTAEDQNQIWGTAKSMGNSVNGFIDRQTVNANKVYGSLTNGGTTDAIDYMLDNYMVNVPASTPQFKNIGEVDTNVNTYIPPKNTGGITNTNSGTRQATMEDF